MLILYSKSNNSKIHFFILNEVSNFQLFLNQRSQVSLTAAVKLFGTLSGTLNMGKNTLTLRKRQFLDGSYTSLKSRHYTPDISSVDL